MNGGLTPTLEKWGFIALGVFSSCCYTSDFAPLDLLRFPQYFSARVENRVAIFNLPKWFPYDQAIFNAGNGRLYSKLRDLPLPKQAKPAGDNQNTLALQLPENLLDIREAALTYWPLFRFAHTGEPFSIKDSTAAFVCRIVEYAARRANLDVTAPENSGNGCRLQVATSSTWYDFNAEGVEDLRRFSMANGNHQMGLDIENRILTLSGELTPNLVTAVNAMLNEKNSLKNCLIAAYEPGSIRLQYQEALRV